MNSPVPSTADVWFDCQNRVCGDDVFASIVLSDSDNGSVEDIQFIPCIGRGLPIPSVCDVQLPKAAFHDFKAGKATEGRGRGQILQNQLDELMGSSVDYDVGYHYSADTDIFPAETRPRQLATFTSSHHDDRHNLNEEHFPPLSLLKASVSNGSKAAIKCPKGDTKVSEAAIKCPKSETKVSRDDDKIKSFSLKDIASQFKN